MMKIYALTLCALTLPLAAHSADTTLKEISARLEKLETELKLSKIQLQHAEQKIDNAEKRAAAAEHNAMLSRQQLQAVEQATAADRILSKKTTVNTPPNGGDNHEIKIGGYARSGILTGRQGTTSTIGPSLTPAGSTGGSVGRLGNESDNGLYSKDNDKRINDGLASDKAASQGFNTMLAYHGDSFYGLRPGLSKTVLLYGQSLGAEVRGPGSDGYLIDNAWTLKFASYGITSLTDRLSLAPLIVAQSSNNRYLDSDHYDWLTLNARLIQEMNQNFALQYEASYQYMDIDPKGFNGNRPVSGSYYKLTFAPTFKMHNVTDFFERPEIRFFATWMNWDKSLDNYSTSDTFGSAGYHSGGTLVFGAQLETWF